MAVVLKYPDDERPGSELREWLGQKVRVETSSDFILGTLVSALDSVVVRGADGEVHRIDGREVESVRVFVGGDWESSAGHRDGAKTTRINVRVTPAQKAHIASIAKRRGLSVSTLLLEAVERVADEH